MNPMTNDGGPAIPRPPAPPPRPKGVVAASLLYVIAAVLWLPIAGADGGTPQYAGLVLIACIISAVSAGGGRHGARIVVTITAGLAFLALAPYAWLGPADPGNPYGAEYAVMDLVAIGAAIVATVLIYSPDSNAYFRACRAIRSTVRRGPPGSADPNGPGGPGGPGPYGGPGPR